MFIKTPRRLIFPTRYPQQILPLALTQKKTKEKIQILGYMILLRNESVSYISINTPNMYGIGTQMFQDYGLNRRGAVQSGTQVPSFRKSLPPPSSE